MECLQYNAVKNAELDHVIADEENQCGVNVSALISSKTDESQCKTGLKSYSLILLLVSSEAVVCSIFKLTQANYRCKCLKLY